MRGIREETRVMGLTSRVQSSLALYELRRIGRWSRGGSRTVIRDPMLLVVSECRRALAEDVFGPLRIVEVVGRRLAESTVTNQCQIPRSDGGYLWSDSLVLLVLHHLPRPQAETRHPYPDSTLLNENEAE